MSGTLNATCPGKYFLKSVQKGARKYHLMLVFSTGGGAIISVFNKYLLSFFCVLGFMGEIKGYMKNWPLPSWSFQSTRGEKDTKQVSLIGDKCNSLIRQ